MHHTVKIGSGFGIVRDHDDRLAQVLVELPQHLQHHFRVFRIQISGRLVGQKDFWFIDNRARNGHTLLLATGKFRRFVLEASREAQKVCGNLETVGVKPIAVNELRDRDIAFGGERWQEIKTLEDKPNLAVPHQGAREGMLFLFIRHTSASLTVQENADPDVRTDLVTALRRLAPSDAPWVHDVEGPDDMPAHVKTMLTGVSLHVPVIAGALALGTWQGIFVAEHRARPHRREVLMRFIGSRA